MCVANEWRGVREHLQTGPAQALVEDPPTCDRQAAVGVKEKRVASSSPSADSCVRVAALRARG